MNIPNHCALSRSVPRRAACAFLLTGLALLLLPINSQASQVLKVSGDALEQEVVTGFGNVVKSANRDVFYVGIFEGDDPGMFITNRGAVWVRPDGTETIIFSSSDQIPGAPEGTTFVGVPELFPGNSGDLVIELNDSDFNQYILHFDAATNSVRGVLSPGQVFAFGTVATVGKVAFENSHLVAQVDLEDGNQQLLAMDLSVNPPAVTAIVKTGDMVDGLTVDNLDFIQPLINASGLVVFLFEHFDADSGSSRDAVATFDIDSGQLAVVLFAEQEAPGFPAGVFILRLTGLGLNSDGMFSVQGRVFGSGISNANSDVIWICTGVNCTVALQEGAEPDGLPGVITQTLGAPVRHEGLLAMRTLLEGTGIDSTNNIGFLLVDLVANTIDLVSQEGDVLADGTIRDYRAIALSGTLPVATIQLFSFRNLLAQITGGGPVILLGPGSLITLPDGSEETVLGTTQIQPTSGQEGLPSPTKGSGFTLVVFLEEGEALVACDCIDDSQCPEGVCVDGSCVNTEKPPELDAMKVATLFADNDGSESVTVGDELQYTVKITNSGGAGAPADILEFNDVPDAKTQLIAGTVTTDPSGSRANVILGNQQDDSVVSVEFDSVAQDEVLEVTYRVEITSGEAEALISNQGTVGLQSSVFEHPVILTDDPDTAEEDDPTIVELGAVVQGDTVFADGFESPVAGR